jgi:magnesium transporter
MQYDRRDETVCGARVITSCYRNAAGELRCDVPLDELRAAVSDRGALVWIDIAAGARDEGERVLRDIFHFHHLTIDDCYNALIDPPKVDDYGDYLFIIVHHVEYDDAGAEVASSELNMYVGANYVVTLHKAPLRAVAEVRRRAELRNLVMERGVDFLAHALIDVVVDDFHPIVDLLHAQLDELSDRVLDDPRRQTLQQVLLVKRNVLRLKRSILPQRDVVNRFAHNEYERLIGSEAQMYFRDIYDHTVRVHEMIETLRDDADSALNTYLSSVNNRTNEVMKTLAIVTVIFAPLTLLTGIYGTNFEHLPEVGWDFGYYGMLLLMGTIALALIGWFRWRKWL